MSLGRKTGVNENVRDIEADYLEATIAEYEKFLGAGLRDRADDVAAELKRLGHDVAPKRTSAKEKAVASHVTEKAVEGDTNPKG